MTAILGIHFGHDASAALIVDGRLVAAVSEERFKRVKLFRGFPEQAIAAVLRESACAPSDVDRVAVATEETFRLLGPREVQRRLHTGIREKFERQRYIAQAVFEYFVGGRPDEKKAAAEEDEARKIFLDALAERGFSPAKVRVYDHHLCHAATAFYCSPFERSHVFTVDGRGDGVCASAGRGDRWQLSVAQRVPDLHSVGMFYAAITLFLGFRPNRHEGKITGLAAYGDPELLYGNFRKLFAVDREKKTMTLQIAGAPKFISPDDVRRALKKLPMSLKDRINLMAQRDFDVMLYTANWYSMLHYLSEAADGASREAVAAAAQKVAEDVVSEWIASFVNPIEPLPATLAGGVFANVKINQRIRELPGVSNVYVQPAMGDDGLSLGAALLECVAHAKETNTALPREDDRPSRMRDVYLGPAFGESEILGACRAESVQWKRTDRPAEEIADLIHQGKLVGRFAGRMEWGPRALGNRSILIRPIDKTINDSVNQRLARTEFMPFAPSMLESVASDYMAEWKPEHVAAEFMTITYGIRPERQKEIEAVVHVDGTARPQVVRRDVNESYWQIIEAYQRRSGLGVIVNTSFNMHEEPIVCTPQDAIRSLTRGCVDVLAIEDYLVTPR